MRRRDGSVGDLCGWAVFVASAWLCLGQAAWAQSVALDLSACDEPAPGDVRALLVLELRDRLLNEGESAPPDAQHVQVSCSQGEAQLWLRDTELRRTVPLSSVPPALRARLLALSVAELTRPPQLAPAAPATVTPAKPVPRAQPLVEPSARPPTYLLWLGAQAQALPLFGLGGSLLLRVRIRELLAWSSAFSLAEARSAIDRGTLWVRSTSLLSGPALLLEHARFSLHVGVGARAGLLQLSGEPADAQSTAAASFDAWYIGPALFAGATWSFGSHACLALELEVDHALRGVRADVQGVGARTLTAWRAGAVLGAGVAW
jgi:hypothetical protein